MHGYRVGRAFDGERVLPGGALVLVDGSRVVGVEPSGSPAPEGCDVTEYDDATIMPGLVDAHVHLCADAGPNALVRVSRQTPEQREAVIRAALLAHLAAGVTAVRDLGDHRWAVVGRIVREDEPRVVSSGPPITTPRGHCSSMGGEAQGRPALRDAVQQRAARGADLVKVMVSGGAMTPGSDLLTLQYRPAELALVVSRAHDAGLPVTAHAHSVRSLAACLTAGTDGVEHGTCLTPRGLVVPRRLVADLAAAGTPLCPTLGRMPGSEPSPEAVAVAERTGWSLAGRLAQVAAFHAAGVRIVSGSDAGIHPGKPHGVLPHAVVELVEAGIPPAAALASATSAAADACRLGADTGLLRAGRSADLLVVDGDPLRDIRDLLRVRAVVLRGREAGGPRPPS